VEEVLNKDMATVGDFLLTLKLKLSTTKMVWAAFHLNNKEAWTGRSRIAVTLSHFARS